MYKFQDDDDFGQIGNTLAVMCYVMAHLVKSVPDESWTSLKEGDLAETIDNSQEGLSKNEAMRLLIDFSYCWKKRTQAKGPPIRPEAN